MLTKYFVFSNNAGILMICSIKISTQKPCIYYLPGDTLKQRNLLVQ